MAHRPEGFLCIYGFSMFKISAYPADVLDKGKICFLQREYIWKEFITDCSKKGF